jgi:hypothetical protein
LDGNVKNDAIGEVAAACQHGKARLDGGVA